MRPPVGGSSAASSPPLRKPSISAQGSTPTGPTTFFMATESMLDNGQTPTASMSETTFGVRSIADERATREDTVHARDEGRRRSTIIAPRSLVRDVSKDSLSMGSFGSSSSNSSSPSRPSLQQRINTAEATNSKPPLMFQSPILGTSEPGSPKSTSMGSFRPSDDEMMDDQNSQAIMSDSDDEFPLATTIPDGTTAPQFIMPSIMMPSRRPFSEKGMSIGRLKVLLAGSSGVGKTSLIKSIVQTCEDIVHIDATMLALPHKRDAKKARRESRGYNRTEQIYELYASTKAYPAWWSELENGSFLRRRRSGDGTVLERNICFVDTPGYDAGTSILEGMDKVLRHIETQMTKTLDTAHLDDAEMLHLLGGGGGSQVDVVLYMLSHPLKPADLEFLKQLSFVSNVVPLLARVDGVSIENIDQVKASISNELASAGLKLFPLIVKAPAHQIYAVCSSPSKDLENMDASLLMQSDYIQPLQASDLSTVIEHLFLPETIRRLKYYAAKKVVQNRQNPRGGVSTNVRSPLRTSISSNSPRFGTLLPGSAGIHNQSQALINRAPGTMTYNQAAVTDHALREERLARVNLANWATNLQRSLAKERTSYESIVKAERAEWLKARLGECIFESDALGVGNGAGEDLALVQKGLSRAESKSLRPLTGIKAGQQQLHGVVHDPADPLGLLRWSNELSSNGILLLKVMSGAGIVGALGTFLFFTVRNWTDGGSNVHPGQPSSLFTGWWEMFD